MTGGFKDMLKLASSCMNDGNEITWVIDDEVERAYSETRSL